MMTNKSFCTAMQRVSHTALGIMALACMVAPTHDALAQHLWGAAGQNSRAQAVSQQRTSGYLGVYIQDLTEDLAMYLNFEGRHGVVVREVVEGSPAAEAGLQRGDVLVRLGDMPLMHAMQLTDMVMAQQPGTEVALHVMRGETPLTINVTLGESVRQPLGTLRQLQPPQGMQPRIGMGGKIVRPHVAPPSAPQASVPQLAPFPQLHAPLLPPVWDPFGAGPLGPAFPGLSFPEMLDDMLMSDDLLGAPWGGMMPGDPVIHEADGKIEIRVPFPAVSAQVTVDVTSRSVVMRTSINEQREESRDGRVIHYQSRQGTSVRTIHLPSAVDFAAAEGRHENGELIITIPEAQQDATGSHQIVISVTTAENDEQT